MDDNGRVADMDITALLNAYSRHDGTDVSEAPLEAAVAVFADAIEEVGNVAPATDLDAAVNAAFEEIAASEPIDISDPELLAEPADTSGAGKHRADVPTDSVSPLVPVAATHRLSA
jgi:hypothetical protein